MCCGLASPTLCVAFPPAWLQISFSRRTFALWRPFVRFRLVRRSLGRSALSVFLCPLGVLLLHLWLVIVSQGTWVAFLTTPVPSSLAYVQCPALIGLYVMLWLTISLILLGWWLPPSPGPRSLGTAMAGVRSLWDSFQPWEVATATDVLPTAPLFLRAGDPLSAPLSSPPRIDLPACP